MRISDWSSDVCSSDLIVVCERDLLGLGCHVHVFRECTIQLVLLLLDVCAKLHQGFGYVGVCLSEGIHQFSCARLVSVMEECVKIGSASCRERVCQYV